ncbi:TIGR00341 family protein [Nocardioides sp.]|uniref:TIGR00341 family protein n=1 Tax=Nocardioides sp. TaxID=35761 RepID=UPI00378382DC
MWVGLRDQVLPENQRRSLADLEDDLDFGSGDRRAKRSAFWTMLVLSSVIASCGVLSDSTATVIGAMIIAPLSTPIMGIALAVAEQRRNGSIVYVLVGGTLVVAIGMLFSLAIPGGIALMSDSQISSRTSPGLVDLVAAVATGLAGAVALARRDVAAVLPGVAIAISLVPPLAVVGVCLGQGDVGLAAGALVLFLSNLLAMVAAGVLMFTALGYSTEAVEDRDRPRRRTYVLIAVLVVLVAVPLGANTWATYVLARYDADVRHATETWLRPSPDAAVTKVDFSSLDEAHVYVRHTGQLPPYAGLLDDLEGVLPDGVTIYVDSTVGESHQAGTVGD